jgi:hypothetical protein
MKPWKLAWYLEFAVWATSETLTLCARRSQSVARPGFDQELFALFTEPRFPQGNVAPEKRMVFTKRGGVQNREGPSLKKKWLNQKVQPKCQPDFFAHVKIFFTPIRIRKKFWSGKKFLKFNFLFKSTKNICFKNRPILALNFFAPGIFFRSNSN